MSQTSEIISLMETTLRREPGTLDLDAPLTTLGVDSIDVVEMVFALEDKYNIEIPYNANSISDPAFANLGSVIALIQSLIEATVAA